MTTDTSEKTRENYLRRQAKRQGLVLQKSRIKKPNIDNYGGYMITDLYTNFVVCGNRWDLDLDEVAEYLDEGEKELTAKIKG